jgi:transcriptional regulator with XRE-family HTH domain
LGTRSWKSVKGARLAPHAIARVTTRAHQEVLGLTLKELRRDLDITQADLASAADMTQSEMSRLESREDHRVSSLRRYVEALGGEIEITAIIGGRRVKLTDV